MIERPLQPEFSRFIPDLALHGGYQGYHLTVVYKDAQTPRAADRALKKAIPKILSRAVDGHWIRAAKRGDLVGIGFLDTPGSRGSSHRVLAPGDAQDDYHHHCILLVKPRSAIKINRIASLPIKIEDDPSHSPFRRKMARRSARLLQRVRGILLSFDMMLQTPIRSLMIQRLPDEEDIERVTNYAAKSLDRLIGRFPDEAFSVLTKLRERPRKRIAR